MADVVLDGSAAGGWFFPDEHAPQHDRMLQDALSGKITLMQPHLWLLECVNMIRTGVRRGRLTAPLAHKALHHWLSIPVTYADLGSQAGHLLDTALRRGLTAYDAAYLCLAESLGAPLYSLDADLLALRSEYGWIRPVKDYATPSFV